MMRISVVAIALILVAAFACAQPAGPALTQLKAYLSLSDAQVQSIQAVQSNLRTSTASLRQQIKASDLHNPFSHLGKTGLFMLMK